MNIVHLPDDIKKEFKLDSEGKAFVSIRGAARLCDISHVALVNLFKGGNINPPKLVKILTGHRFDPGSFSETGIPDIALIHILKYYAFKANRTTEQAERFFDAMAAIGVRTWIQNELGWNQTDNKKLPIWDEARADGKDIFRSLADAVKRYIDRHPEISDNRKKFLYSNTVDRLNLNTFGKRSKALKEERGIRKGGLLRDSFSVKELFNVSRIEDLAARLIDDQDIYPPNAVIEAMDRMLLKRLR